MKTGRIGKYEYLILRHDAKWSYQIRRKFIVTVKSKDYFESLSRAIFAAIGHITIMEKGENK